MAGGLGAGADCGCARISETIRVGVDVPEPSVHGVGLVGVTVAVVVQVVAVLFRAGVDRGIGIVAVGGIRDVAGWCLTGLGGAGRITVAVGVGVRVPGGLFREDAITVVVSAVAAFRSAGVDVSPRIVAVEVGIGTRTHDHVGHARETVTVGIETFVDVAVTVVVSGVADLTGIGIGLEGGVVAVGGVRDIAVGDLVAGFVGDRCVAIAVVIHISVVGRGDSLVDVAVAVIVHLVADLLGVGVNEAIGVVAVVTAVDVSRGRLTGVDLIVLVTVAVVVGIGVPAAGVHQVAVVVVDLAVAVVVVAVADLVGTGVDELIAIVAVGAVFDVAGGLVAGIQRVADASVAVTVAVCVPGGGVGGIIFIGQTVAVVVDAVAVLVGAGVDGGVGVVAVLAIVVAIAIGILTVGRSSVVGIEQLDAFHIPPAVASGCKHCHDWQCHDQFFEHHVPFIESFLPSKTL